MIQIALTEEEKEQIYDNRQYFVNPNVESLVIEQHRKAEALYKKGAIDDPAKFQEERLTPIQKQLGAKEEGSALLYAFHYKGVVLAAAVTEWTRAGIPKDVLMNARWFEIARSGEILHTVLELESRNQFVQSISIYTALRQEML